MVKEKIIKKKGWLYIFMSSSYLYIGIDKLIKGDDYLTGIALVLGGVSFIFWALKAYLESRYAPRLINIINIFLIVLFSSAILLSFLKMLRIIYRDEENRYLVITAYYTKKERYEVKQ